MSHIPLTVTGNFSVYKISYVSGNLLINPLPPPHFYIKVL
jgi:hypothetical protein